MLQIFFSLHKSTSILWIGGMFACLYLSCLNDFYKNTGTNYDTHSEIQIIKSVPNSKDITDTCLNKNHILSIDSLTRKVLIIDDITIRMERVMNKYWNLFVGDDKLLDSIANPSDILLDRINNSGAIIFTKKSKKFVCTFFINQIAKDIEIYSLDLTITNPLKYSNNNIFFIPEEDGLAYTDIYKYNIQTRKLNKVVSIINPIDSNIFIHSYHYIPLSHEFLFEIGNWDGGLYNTNYIIVDSSFQKATNITKHFSALGSLDNYTIQNIDCSMSDKLLFFYFSYLNDTKKIKNIAFVFDSEYRIITTDILYKDYDLLGYSTHNGQFQHYIYLNRDPKNRSYLIGIEPCISFENCLYKKIDTCLLNNDSSFTRLYKSLYRYQ
jgi:hypothetical protein